MIRTVVPRPFVYLFSAFATIVAGLVPTTATAQDFPAVMVVDGVVRPNVDVSPRTDDDILVLDDDEEVEATGRVLDDRGGFVVQIDKTQSFNNTELTLRLQRGGTVYELLEGSDPFRFRFSGGFPFTRLRGLSLAIGDVVSSEDPPPLDPGSDAPDDADAGGGSTGGGDAPTGDGSAAGDGESDGDGDGDDGEPATGSGDPLDVDGDGSFSQSDIDLVKDVVAGRAPNNGRADTNGDGIINTRDIIEMIKTLRRRNRPTNN